MRYLYFLPWTLSFLFELYPLSAVAHQWNQVEAWYGVTQTRQVYEKAIKDLNEEGAREVRPDSQAPVTGREMAGLVCALPCCYAAMPCHLTCTR